MINTKKKHWLLVLLTLLLSGCGSSKKTIDTSRGRTETKYDAVIERLDSLVQKWSYKNSFSEITFEPIDPTKPSHARYVQGGDTVLFYGNNTKVFQKRETTDSISLKTNVIKEKEEVKAEVKKDVKKKKLERKGNATQIKWSIWGIVLIIIIASIVHFFRNKLPRKNID